MKTLINAHLPGLRVLHHSRSEQRVSAQLIRPCGSRVPVSTAQALRVCVLHARPCFTLQASPRIHTKRAHAHAHQCHSACACVRMGSLCSVTTKDFNPIHEAVRSVECRRSKSHTSCAVVCGVNWGSRIASFCRPIRCCVASVANNDGRLSQRHNA